jgi:glyoxylase-like metal-dependent hydrolase (beta-lactamase superfamily II)
MNVRRLYLGSIAGPLGPATPFNGYLIDHPGGLTLVDTGFGTSLALLGGAGPDEVDASAGAFTFGEKTYPWIRRTTPEALLDHGIEPGDVKYIINTHVGDHSGDNHLFPNATFIIQQPEVNWTRAKASTSPLRIEEWDFPGAKLELLQGEDVEVLPGLKCIFTPGHTPGHQSVLYESDGRKMLFCGDAAYTNEIFDNPEMVQPNTELYYLQIQSGERGLEMFKESVAKLKSLDADEVYFAHDANYRLCNAGHVHVSNAACHH